MRKALVAVGVVLVLLVGADLGLHALAQYWIAGQLQSSFDLERRPSVSLGGFPFLPRLVTGRFSSVTVESNGAVKTGRFSVSRVDLTLRDVHFQPDQLLFGNKATIKARGGSGTVILTERDINRAFPATIPVTIRLRGGKVRIRSSDLQGEVETKLRVSDNRLVLMPVEGSLPVEMRVALPVLVRGLTYTGVEIQGSRARVRFRLTKPRIEVR
ncbi:MAG TPA: DUF2993 domain-containing protein [Actinomycetota bacterium]|jgi:hypothetical protein